MDIPKSEKSAAEAKLGDEEAASMAVVIHPHPGDKEKKIPPENPENEVESSLLCLLGGPITSMVFAVLLILVSSILLDDIYKAIALHPDCDVIVKDSDDLKITAMLALAIGICQLVWSVLSTKLVGARDFLPAHLCFAVFLGFILTAAYSARIYNYGTGILFMHTSFLNFVACLAGTL